MKAKIINRYSVEVIDYDKKVESIKSTYNSDIEMFGVADGVLQPIADKEESERTADEVKLLKKRKEIEADKEAEMLLLSDYLDFVPSEHEGGELGEFETAVPFYVKKGNAIVQKWEVVKEDESKISSKIDILKSELSDSDYKIMKCYEASILGTEMPYNVETLIAERQAKRNEINRLEKLL